MQNQRFTSEVRKNPDWDAYNDRKLGSAIDIEVWLQRLRERLKNASPADAQRLRNMIRVIE